MQKTHPFGCVSRFGRGVLIGGDSGAGKSRLALALVHRGWQLVSDDRSVIDASSGELRVRAPDALRGLIEIRGVGIMRLPCLIESPAMLLVMLAASTPRLPAADRIVLEGQTVPRLPLAQDDFDLPGKVAEALRALPLSG
jgi:HPr kinase/phosphorylase